MIHLDCREHLPCVLAEVDRLRAINQQQADGWIETHNELTRLRGENAELRAAFKEMLNQAVELRRRVQMLEDTPACGHPTCTEIDYCAESERGDW